MACRSSASDYLVPTPAAEVGEGAIDSRAYAEIVSSDPLYPLMKVDLSCSNTYAAYARAATDPLGRQAPDGTPCDNGGTFVDSKSSTRNMTWWDLAYLGNMVQNGTTGFGSQSNFRMMVFNYAKNPDAVQDQSEQIKHNLPSREERKGRPD